MLHLQFQMSKNFSMKNFIGINQYISTTLHLSGNSSFQQKTSLSKMLYKSCSTIFSKKFSG